MTGIDARMHEIARAAQSAASAMRTISTDAKNDALRLAAENIESRGEAILAENDAECARAREKGKSEAFLDRMKLDPARLAGVAAALREIAALNDPVGRILRSWSQPNGLRFKRVATPIGVVAVIYESRPNVTVDAAAIALKAGNAVILRGGSECIRTNQALYNCVRDACAAAQLPAAAAQFVDTPDRAAVGALLSGLDGAIDLVIPRGGKSLVARVQQDARAPVLSHLDGVCHVYVHRDADPEMAVRIAVNAKMRRPGVCGAAETLLIDRAAVDKLAPMIAGALHKAGCALRGDTDICAAVPDADPATEEDFYTEYLDAVVSIAAVDDLDAALAHIEKYGSGHTEAIVTDNDAAARDFLARVDSAIVLHNASTQFADGGEFGLGAEIGIATGRLHARGPVGVEELTTYKTVVTGDGAIRP